MHSANSDSHNLDLSHNLEQYHLSSGVGGRAPSFALKVCARQSICTVSSERDQDAVWCS